MTRKTKKQRATKKREPLPEHFASLEEAADFWDSHDSADYDENFVDVDFEVDLKKRSLLVDGRLYDEVRAIAKKKRIPADKLVSRWIKEKLRSAA
jgi:hypothetical protein